MPVGPEIDKTMVARGDSIVSAKTNYIVSNSLTETLKLLTKEEDSRPLGTFTVTKK